MARMPKMICASCEHRIEIDDTFCEHCGQPTSAASYENRVDWEVEQWRRSRYGTSGGTALKTRAPAPARTSARADRASAPRVEVRKERAPKAPKTPKAPKAPKAPRVSLLEWLKRTLAGLRGPIKPRPTEAPATIVIPQVIEPAPPMLVIVPDPEPEVKPAAPTETVAAAAPLSVPSTDAPAPAELKPRKRPAKPRPKAPTNKDMLKETLTVLTRVERRLHHLEQEVASIPVAVRETPSTTSLDDDSAASAR